jgi:putative addiction module component (TIGR02574 family)
VTGVDVTKIPDPPGYAELSIEEKIDYIQLLWDRLADESDPFPVPDSHIKLVQQRMEAYRRDPSRVRSAFAIIDELMNRRA